MKQMIIVVIIALLILTSCSSGVSPQFAQCLTDNGVVMYGTYWCPHCQNQKEMFGDSWEFVNYIECSLPERAGQTQICKEDGITGYPTWKFSDGSELKGEVTLEQLALKSGCSLEGA